MINLAKGIKTNILTKYKLLQYIVMAQLITVNCPKCGKPVAVNCRYSNGSSSDQATCRCCGKLVTVWYNNDSFGFRITRVY